MKKLLYSVLALSLLSLTSIKDATAQNAGHFCATDEVRKDLVGRNPLLLDAERMNEELLQNAIAEMRANRDEEEPIMVIPVVFHVIHNNGPENISDAQIINAMSILNRDYRKQNADTASIVAPFDEIAADTRIEFRLATKDFMGNCTNGIERIQSMETYVGGPACKKNQWPRNRYLNIWVVNKIAGSAGSTTTLGYSQLPPDMVGDAYAHLDGIVVRYDCLGDIEQGVPQFDRTLTHEVGHYLNLIHTWGGTNDPGVSCDGTDAVDDTPPTMGHMGGCTEHLYDFECTKRAFPTTPVYPFTDVVLTSGAVDPTPVYQAANNDLTMSAFTSNGVSENPMVTGSFGYAHWDSGAEDGETVYANLTGTINTSKYYQFTITPEIGRAYTLLSLVFQVRRSSTGPRTFAIRTSLDNFNSNLTVQSNSSTNPGIQRVGNVFFIKEDVTNLLSGNTLGLPLSFKRLHQPITIRIYAWNSEDSDGVFEIDNFTLNGDYGVYSNAQNYMDYTNCLTMFTQGQKERMRAALSVSTAGRNNLWTQTNRINTGTWDEELVVCAPSADFYADKRFACIGAPVKFFDNSSRAEVTSWSWTFQDGEPAVSNVQNPTVTFNSYGEKTITLTVTNAVGEDTKTIERVVRIAPNSPEFWDIPLSEGFDSGEDFWNLWVPINADNTPSSWQRTAEAGYSNNTSARLNSFDDMQLFATTGVDAGIVDELVSPSFTLNGLSNPSLSFRWAFATQNLDVSGINDRLQIMYSIDCGSTWNLFTSGTINPGSVNPIPVSGGTIEGFNLVTDGHHSTAYVPHGQSEWNYVVMNFPNVGPNVRVRFKFVFTSNGFANNLYLDDVNLNATVGVDELHSDFYGVNLFPNPSTSSTTLVYTNNNLAPVQISLTDMSGRIVESWTPSIVAPGQQKFDINTSDLAKGVYMVNMRSESNNLTLRLLVQ